ncbi:MAG: DUF3792 family protein [Ruminococcaceae bacterium]|nr:DUF3792 family protein [Oscillospiraceae bacterium]
MSTPKRKASSKRRRSSAQGEHEALFPTLIKNTALAFVITTGVFLLLIAAITALLLTTEDPDRYGVAAGTVLLYTAALFLGSLTARLQKKRAPLFCGIASGALLLVALFLFSLVLPDSGNQLSHPLSVGLHALLFPFCMAGAFLATREKKRVRRHRR